MKVILICTLIILALILTKFITNKITDSSLDKIQFEEVKRNYEIQHVNNSQLNNSSNRLKH